MVWLQSELASCSKKALARCVLLLSTLALHLVLAGCGYSNPHGSQDTPPILRLTTIPAGASAWIEDLNLTLQTPCDLPGELDTDCAITVTKTGYLSFKGELGDLPQIARGTYQLKMKKEP